MINLEKNKENLELSFEDERLYAEYKAKFPHWSHSQILSRIRLNTEIEKTMSTKDSITLDGITLSKEEYSEWKNLDENQKKRYRFERLQMNATHNYAMTYLTMNKFTDQALEQGGQDVQDNPEVMKNILQKTADWMKEKCKRIYDTIKDNFSDLLNNKEFWNNLAKTAVKVARTVWDIVVDALKIWSTTISNAQFDETSDIYD